MMNYQIKTEPFSHVIIEETFDEEQYEMYSVKLKSSITGALGDWLVRSNRIIII